MPLSEQEQRLLDEMERHLMHNDADVVSASRAGKSLSYRNIVYGSILVLVGIAALIVGISSSLIIVGVIAFLIMVAGVILAVTPSRTASAPRADAGTKKASPAPQSSGSFMDRMNERWDRRNDKG
ncbi:DUF3040 domain-containing protein [Microbacterium invictum]|uniref:DUF3040 domain-containing protein n=1 Tax=Microbacterium invictum TaxID=515415 RepID=A0AA40SNE0_9MICO|nr:MULTISPECIES: DUF3040 domain-containing protein [Microbacterium]MBB4139388.1 hypothetical protein [Microbacterium invictum]